MCKLNYPYKCMQLCDASFQNNNNNDGKRPDRVSIVPWKCGQLLVRDGTCPDASYSAIDAQQVGAVAQQVEENKMTKCKHLDSCHFSPPVAIETTGVFGPTITKLNLYLLRSSLQLYVIYKIMI